MSPGWAVNDACVLTISWHTDCGQVAELELYHACCHLQPSHVEGASSHPVALICASQPSKHPIHGPEENSENPAHDPLQPKQGSWAAVADQENSRRPHGNIAGGRGSGSPISPDSSESYSLPTAAARRRVPAGRGSGEGSKFGTCTRIGR